MKPYLFLVFLLGFLTTWSQSILPSHNYKITPDQLGMAYEEVRITSTDGAELNSWLLKTPASPARPQTFVLVGRGSGNMSNLLFTAQEFVDEGFNVVLFDYRGFGSSTDFSPEPNRQYHQEYIEDFVSVLGWIKSELAPEQIGVMAFEMGTLVASAGYSEARFDYFAGEGFLEDVHAVSPQKSRTESLDLANSREKAVDKISTNNIDAPMMIFKRAKEVKSPYLEEESIVRQKANRKMDKTANDNYPPPGSKNYTSYAQAIVQHIENDRLKLEKE